MDLKYGCFRLGEYPQTHTCPRCGAYIYIDKNGLISFYNSDDKHSSVFTSEIEEIKVDQ